MSKFVKTLEELEGLREEIFIDRVKDMTSLTDAFFDKGLRVAGINGSGGMGKTSFALQFGRQNRKQFPGGSIYLHSGELNAPPEEIMRIIRSQISGHPSLCILDDLEKLDTHHAESLIRNIKVTFHECRIIAISRRQIIGADVSVTLGSLPFSAVMDIWNSTFVKISLKDAGRLYSAVGGIPLVATWAGRLVRDRLFAIEDFENYLQKFTIQGIVRPDGKPIPEESTEEKALVSGLVVASDEVIKYLSDNPHKINELTPRQFEEFIAELLKRQGYEINLTPITRDGGKDIYAARRDTLGTFLYIVECKKYAPHRPVDVAVVRQLYGVVQEERVSGGIIATTSYFTKGATEFRNRVQYQVNLKDYIGIQKWLNDVVRLTIVK